MTGIIKNISLFDCILLKRFNQLQPRVVFCLMILLTRAFCQLRPQGHQQSSRSLNQHISLVTHVKKNTYHAGIGNGFPPHENPIRQPLNEKIMKPTYTHTNNNTNTNTNTSFEHRLFAFINRHADAFEAMARGSTPFGGNWLPERHYVSQDKQGGRTWQPVSPVAHRAVGWTRWVSRLGGKGSGISPVSRSSVNTNDIGINRFRSLRSQS